MGTGDSASAGDGERDGDAGTESGSRRCPRGQWAFTRRQSIAPKALPLLTPALVTPVLVMPVLEVVLEVKLELVFQSVSGFFVHLSTAGDDETTWRDA